MRYFIYETTNNINGRKYRGMHATENVDDLYFGSGKVLLQAIKAHGKKNFSKIILEECSSFEDMCEKEKLYVNADWVNDETTYNLKLGGLGSRGCIPWNKDLKGVQEAWNKNISMPKQTEESNLKRSNTLKQKYLKEDHHSKGTEPWNKGKKGAQEAWNKGLVTEKFQCPHCNKQADIGNLRRWHLDNCRYKN